MLTYCNYHRHSHYTNVRISDSAVTNEAYALRAKEIGDGILSSCEHGWQGNYYEVVKLAKAHGLKPLVSAECYWVKDRSEKDRTNCHIFVAAMNENGRRALNSMLSEANLTGFYGQPRVDLPLLLSLPQNDVIVTTACVAFWRYEDVDEVVLALSKYFGNHFFLEVQYHNTPSQIALNKRILELRRKFGCGIIMGCDSHYIYPEQAQSRTDFINSKGIEYPDEEGWMLDYPDGDTAYQRFANQCVLSHEEILEAMENTKVFLNVDEYESPVFNDDIKLPSLYEGWTQEQKDAEYQRLVWNGWEEYKKGVSSERWPEYESEIKKEIQTVLDTKMADYFIIDYEVMKKGKENGGWLTKSGRGSGASFFTNTLLGFSDIDRISAPVHMYPERFMSTTRILQSKGIPDIDMNEAPTAPFVQAQAEVLGQAHSFPMIAYGTMKKSAAWKLYAKSQGIPFAVANAVSEQIARYEMAVKHADEDDKDSIDINKYISKEYREVYDKSAEYLGLITSWSIAPCSSLIYEGDIREEIGLVRVKDNICCLMDGHWAEEGHFLKNDHLKVSVVELIYKAYRRIGMEPPPVKTLLEMCPPTDPAWDVYEKGCTLGINQCESEGTRSKAMKYKPRNISELSAFVAAIRPGGASFYKKFESREPFSYGVKAFDDLIQTKEFPYSFLLYQEQVMRALNYAGIDMADCYTAIKNIAKKRADKVLAYKDTFIDGFAKAIIRDEGKSDEEAQALAESLWKVVEDSAGYSFNASHSYCVAIDSLYGAWLKAHHPLEFYEQYIAIMEEKGDKDKVISARKEASEYFGIVFEPLRFGQNNSSTHIGEHNTIISSIATIKGYSAAVGRNLYYCSQRAPSTFVEVLDLMDSKGIKQAKYEPLIQVGYFSDFGNQGELEMIAESWEALKQGYAKNVRKDSVEGLFKEVIENHTIGTTKTGKDAASYSFSSRDDVLRCLGEYEGRVKALGLPETPLRTQIHKCVEILGFCDVKTGNPDDRRRLIILDVMPIKAQVSRNGAVWGYRVTTKSLGTGKLARLTVKAEMYDNKPLNEGDIVYADNVYLNDKGYWYLTQYTIE